MHGIAFAPSGCTVAACGDSGRLTAWTRGARVSEGGWRTVRRSNSLQTRGDTALAVIFLSEAQVAVAAGSAVEVWCLSNLQRLGLMDLLARVLSLATVVGRRRLAAVTESGATKVWRRGRQCQEFRIDALLRHPHGVECLSFGQSGGVLAAGGGSSLSFW